VEPPLTIKDTFNGYFWHKGIFYRSLPETLFPQNITPAAFKAVLSGCDGCFSIVIVRGNHVLAAVDRVRSLPLFYAQKGNELLLSPDANELKHQLGDPSPDQDALAEFLLTGYNCYGDTLIQGLKQLEAGQCLVWDTVSANLEVKDYFLYQHLYEPMQDPLEAMDQMHVSIIQKLIDSAEGRTLVLPLSGGYDSRTIAIMLKRLGYDKVICFTYGNSLHGECSTSRKVAKFLNFPWVIVEHNRRMWYKAYHSGEMRQYYRYAANLSSSPHIQDWLAVQQLKERKLIPEDSIIVPGHSGGMPQGDNLPQILEDKEEISSQDLVHAILARHYSLWYCPNDLRNKLFFDRVKDYLQIPQTLKAEIAASVYDEWDWRQRQSKFIVNSVRVYEFFGYEWRLPFWDLEFMNFWQRVPLAQRMHRGLMKQYVQRYQNIPLPTYHDFPWPQRIRNKYARMQVGNIMDPRYGRFLDYRNRHDYINTRVSTLLAPNLAYPEFINGDLTILNADINAIQALTYIRELVARKL
jgi:asparagine synthase (glutamine-hydrolysing)